MMKYLQRLGRALMLPVAVLPAGAILMGVGYWIDPVQWGAGNQLAGFLIAAGDALISNLPIIFAAGVAYGLSDDKDGASAVSGLVAFLMVTTLLSTGTVANMTGVAPEEVNAAFSKIDNAFIGILSGAIGAAMYNRFRNLKLPTALAFFSGRRSAPIITSFVMIAVSGILFVVWPLVYGALVTLGTSFSSMGPLGAGLFGFFNRLLIPTGLHHALNAVFWFDLINIDDIGRFWGTVEGGVKGVTGMYQAGFFPVMMFGLLGAGLAMYQTAKPENKKSIGSLMLAAGFASFLTGVTEPFEFAFMFAAPALYVVHAALTGLSLFIAASMHWTAGFGFSAGFIDFFLSLKVPLANQPLMLIVQGIVYFGLYYAIFKFLIIKFDLKTPGRGDEELSDATLSTGDSKFAHQAQTILADLGGRENIQNLDYCTTRLRLQINDLNIVDDQSLKAHGAAGVMRPGGNTLHVIVGTEVQFVADEMKKLIS